MTKKLKKKNKKKLIKGLEKQIGVFTQSDTCFYCQANFDKKNDEMLDTWKFVVTESTTTKETMSVRLYCPQCFDRLKEVAKSKGAMVE